MCAPAMCTPQETELRRQWAALAESSCNPHAKHSRPHPCGILCAIPRPGQGRQGRTHLPEGHSEGSGHSRKGGRLNEVLQEDAVSLKEDTGLTVQQRGAREGAVRDGVAQLSAIRGHLQTAQNATASEAEGSAPHPFFNTPPVSHTVQPASTQTTHFVALQASWKVTLSPLKCSGNTQ